MLKLSSVVKVGYIFPGVFLNGVDRFDEDELSAMQIKECAEPLLDGSQTQSSEL